MFKEISDAFFPNQQTVNEPNMLDTYLSQKQKDTYIENINKIIVKNPIENEEDLKRCLKKINNYLIDNPDINKIDTKKLNREINFKGHAFCKKAGQQQIIKKQYTPMSRSKTKPLLDKIEQLEETVEILEDRLNHQDEYIQCTILPILKQLLSQK